MMRWFRRRSKSGGPSSARTRANEDFAHLEGFARERVGVEGFVEPPTAVTQTTLLLVANDGEWTRRRVPNAAAAHAFANKLGIPSYDAQVVGYPQRMREWNRRKAAAEKARAAGETPGQSPA